MNFQVIKNGLTATSAGIDTCIMRSCTLHLMSFVLVTCQKWHLPEGYSIWGIVVLTSLIWKIRPVNNESRPVSSGEYKSFVSKLKVVLIVMMMVAVVLEINHNNTYLNIMISGLLLTAITLIMGKVKYRQYKT